MKREGFGDDGPNNKRNRQNEVEVAFLIPSKVAGSIIGKGGANISKLRSTYKASISIPDCPGPERVLAILAEDVDSILELTKEILPNLSEGGPKNHSPNDDLDVRMLIHQSRAGCVIGKGGAKIKELREKTGCRLKVFSNPAPQSTERVVQLLGKPDQITEGVREVLEVTLKVPVQGPVQNYDPHNYDDFYADEYGGFGAGGGGGGMRGGPRGARGIPPRGMGPPPMGPGRGPMPPPRGGPPPMGGRNGPPGPGPRFNDYGPGPGPRGNFNAPPRDNLNNYGGNFNNYGGNFGPGNRGPGGPSGGYDDVMPETSTQVTIPKDLAGAIIGKAGTRIRKIRADSGAGIEIAEPLLGSTDRIITITGTPHQIQTAQYLLQQSVHEAHPNIGGGRGNF